MPETGAFDTIFFYLLNVYKLMNVQRNSEGSVRDIIWDIIN